MGMDINGIIHTTLTMKEISYIASAIYGHVMDSNDAELKKDMERIGSRLVHEMYEYGTEDHTRKEETVNPHSILKYKY